jgi:hypothetical protein
LPRPAAAAVPGLAALAACVIFVIWIMPAKHVLMFI